MLLIMWGIWRHSKSVFFLITQVDFFNDLSFKHIYRLYNTEADNVSIRVLLVEDGLSPGV